jgi:hypothetical protein
MRKPYSIREFNYDPTSGGIKVMYALYGALLLKGEEVLANAVFQDDTDAIGVYPEISQGNELQTKTVVRYILNKPGVMCQNGVPGPTNFGPNDILFTFSKMFMDLPDDHCMFLPAINTAVFYDQHLPRNKQAVFVGKGIATNPHPDCVVIDRNLARDQEGLAKLLNECEVLNTYDPVSAMTEVARLCGCRVNYLSREYSREDYLKYEPGVNGMTFPDDESISELDCEEFTRHYSQLCAYFYNVSLPNFIKITQKA